jgi:hypothetical protein
VHDASGPHSHRPQRCISVRKMSAMLERVTLEPKVTIGEGFEPKNSNLGIPESTARDPWMGESHLTTLW